MKFISSLLVLILLLSVSCKDLFNTPDKKITLSVKAKHDFSQDQLINLLENRLTKFGIDGIVSPKGNNSVQIEAYLSGDPNIFKKGIISSRQIAFYHTLSLDQMTTYINYPLSQSDSLLLHHYAFSSTSAFAPMFLQAKASDTTTINKLVQSSDFRKELRKGIQGGVKFLWGIAVQNSGELPLYIVEKKNALKGDIIEKASLSETRVGRPSVNMQFNEQASLDWEMMTQKAYIENSQIAVVVDGVVYSAPGVTAGPIKGGRSEITGDFSLEETQQLAIQLNLGYLPPVELLSFEVEPLQ